MQSSLKIHELKVRHVTVLFAYLFVVWGFYRLLFQLPDPFDELFARPLIWLIPVFLFIKKEKSNRQSIGITDKNLFPSLYFSLILALLFAFEGILVNQLKYRGILYVSAFTNPDFVGAFVLSLFAAVSEEITFRGYFFSRLRDITKSEWKANLISSTAWTLIHLPIAILDWRMSAPSLVGYVTLIFLFGVGASLLFARTKNIAAPIILHMAWVWPIMLFR